MLAKLTRDRCLMSDASSRRQKLWLPETEPQWCAHVCAVAGRRNHSFHAGSQQFRTVSSLYFQKYLVVWSRGWWCGAFISKAEADSNLEEEAGEEEDKGGSLPSFSAFLPYSTRTHNKTFISLTLHTICSIKKSIP